MLIIKITFPRIRKDKPRSLLQKYNCKYQGNNKTLFYIIYCALNLPIFWPEFQISSQHLFLFSYFWIEGTFGIFDGLPLLLLLLHFYSFVTFESDFSLAGKSRYWSLTLGFCKKYIFPTSTKLWKNVKQSYLFIVYLVPRKQFFWSWWLVLW